jgi:GT2 family glycosyltransferase
MDEQGKFCYADKPLFFEGNVYANLLVWNFLVSGSNPLIRRQALESVGKFDPTLTHGEDWELYLRLAANWPLL